MPENVPNKEADTLAKNTAAFAPNAIPTLQNKADHLTAADVSEMVGLSIATLRDYRSINRRRFGPPFHKNGKQVIYLMPEVLSWMDSRVSHYGGHHNG